MWSDFSNPFFKLTAFLAFLIFLFRFCSSNDDLWSQFFPNDNQPNSIQNKNNPNIDSTANKYFIDHCAFNSFLNVVIDVNQATKSIKFLIANSNFGQNYYSDETCK